MSLPLFVTSNNPAVTPGIKITDGGHQSGIALGNRHHFQGIDIDVTGSVDTHQTASLTSSGVNATYFDRFFPLYRHRL